MKKTIYLVRHGESEENAGAKITGATSPLSEKGRAQAQALAERATRLTFDVIITSTMLRAQQTGQAIADKTGKPLESIDVLVERSMPSTGLGRSVLEPELVKIEDHLVDRLVEHSYRHSDEENFSDLLARVTKAMTYLENRPEARLLVISHGAFLKFFIGKVIFGEELSGKEARAMMQKLATINTGISVLMFDPEHKYGPWRVLTYNDHAHLG